MRKKIGILFIFKSRWIGGLYYILNIIQAFEYLPEELQPEITLFFNKRTKAYLEVITYNKINFVEVDVDFTLSRYFKSLILNKNLFFSDEFKKYGLEVLFPFNDFVGTTKGNKIKLISWIPDFQHKFYPEYFGKLGLRLRELRFRGIVSKTDGLVLSSESAYRHFKKFYNPPIDFKTHVVRFTSIINVAELPEKELIDKKYDLHNDYFIVCNQFYPHKNHLFVLKALKVLKDQGINYFVVFTGKPDQSQDIKLLTEMEQFVVNNELNAQVKFLGLLPRTDQLALMKYSLSVIQPSKFEGWSTVIEDAKTLQKLVIASNLDVHTEQLGENGLIFDPDNASELADCMIKAKKTPANVNLWESLAVRTEKFGTNLLAALN
jgi:glycosyltransferase involved in cell wall biosynthesis